MLHSRSKQTVVTHTLILTSEEWYWLKSLMFLLITYPQQAVNQVAYNPDPFKEFHDSLNN